MPPSIHQIGNFSSDAPLGHARYIDERSRYRSHDQAMASMGLHQQDVRDGATQTVGRHGGKRQLHVPYLNIKPKADWWDMHMCISINEVRMFILDISTKVYACMLARAAHDASTCTFCMRARVCTCDTHATTPNMCMRYIHACICKHMNSHIASA